MWLPVFRYEDGYGLTYGARFAFVDLLGPSTRISVPLTWGGERRASVALERTFGRGPLSRIEVSGGTWRREHPPTGEGERRTFGAVRVERAFGPSFRLGARGETGNVDFGQRHDSLGVAGVDAVLDTRRDPSFARNAVYAGAGWERVWYGPSDTWRVNTDVRGYLGLPGSVVVVARVQNSSAGDPLPAYEQQYLGGAESVRGFELGYRAGDQLTAASLELRLPVTSPVRLGRFGVAAFVDRGAVYDAGVSVRSARFDTGIGAGVFATMPVLSFRVDVAHGLDAGTRVHVSLGARF
jgi:outer membrane protein assembly factor BamA